MGTAERYGAPGTGAATITEAEREPRVPGQGISAGIPATDIVARTERVRKTGTAPVPGTGPRPVAGVTDVDDGADGADVQDALLPETGEREEQGERPAGEAGSRGHYRPLWVEEPADRRRLPDPVRASAVRAVIIIAVTLIQAMVAFLCTLAGSWLAFPMVLSSVASTVVATWGALDVWVTRQVWNQRNGVVSEPSSTARALRRERRKARRQERTAERAKERIQRRGGAGQLSHS